MIKINEDILEFLPKVGNESLALLCILASSIKENNQTIPLKSVSLCVRLGCSIQKLGYMLKRLEAAQLLDWVDVRGKKTDGNRIYLLRTDLIKKEGEISC